MTGCINTAGRVDTFSTFPVWKLIHHHLPRLCPDVSLTKYMKLGSNVTESDFKSLELCAVLCLNTVEPYWKYVNHICKWLLQIALLKSLSPACNQITAFSCQPLNFGLYQDFVLKIKILI